jgi:hypothetical protein
MESVAKVHLGRLRFLTAITGATGGNQRTVQRLQTSFEI